MTKAWCAGLAVLMCSSALAQYQDSDPRSPRYYDHQRQQREQQEQNDKEEGERIRRQSAQDAESYRQFMDNQRKLQERLSGAVERDRAMFLTTPPIPPQKNALLGQWRLDRTRKKPANAFAEINAAISQPACEMVFGDGIWDFRPKALYGIDAGFGETKLTDVDYRGNEGLIGVIPKSGKLFVFKILGGDRVQELTSTRIGADPCNFVRVGAGARSSGTPAAASQSANAPANAATAPGNARAGAAGPSARPASTIQYGSYVCGNERVEVFYCRNDRGQPVPEIDNSCAVEYPDRPRRNPSFAVSATVLKSDLVKQLATCKLSELHLPGLQMARKRAA